ANPLDGQLKQKLGLEGEASMWKSEQLRQIPAFPLHHASMVEAPHKRGNATPRHLATRFDKTTLSRITRLLGAAASDGNALASPTLVSPETSPGAVAPPSPSRR